MQNFPSLKAQTTIEKASIEVIVSLTTFLQYTTWLPNRKH